MQSKNIGKVKQDYLKKIQPFLQWKLNNNQYVIDDVQIARYADISLPKAEAVLAELIKLQAVSVDIKINCPNCNMVHTIESTRDLFACHECGEEFYPESNKRLIHYKYVLNPNSKLIGENKNIKSKRHKLVEVKSQLGGCGEMDKKVKVFLSYSHKDEEYKNELDKHLSVLRRSEKIDTWNDRMLQVGTKLDEDIKKHLREDDIFIFLISADFIASDYCYNIEMQKAIERAKANECVVAPVIVRPCLWQELPIKEFLALPKDGKPISKYDDKDEAYTEVVSAIRKLIDSFEAN